MAKQNIQCPIPSNELDRLSAVRAYEILDSQPEVDFDALTRLAANALNMPAAVIGMMDANRLWFKSQLGLGVPQLDRQIAFCAYAVLNPEGILVLRKIHSLRSHPTYVFMRVRY
jgi:hypothetical protein